MSYIFECQFHLFKELIHTFICVLLIQIFFFFAFSLFAKNKTYLLPNVVFFYSRPVIFFQLLRQLHTRSEELTYWTKGGPSVQFAGREKHAAAVFTQT